MTKTPTSSYPFDPAQPKYKTLRARSVWRGRFRADIEIRDFSVATGEPVKAGGDASAPSPMELILAGLEGCLTVVVETVAAERGLVLRAIEIASEAVMDLRGYGGFPGVRPYYEQVDTVIEVAFASVGIPDGFAREVESRCPALTMVRASGVPVAIQWRESI